MLFQAKALAAKLPSLSLEQGTLLRVSPQDLQSCVSATFLADLVDARRRTTGHTVSASTLSSLSGAVGKDAANPTAMLLAAANMLRHMQLHRYADVITKAVHTVIKAGKVRTRDLGGYASSSEFTHAIIQNIK